MIMKFKVFRYDPENDDKPYYQGYEIEADPKDRILDCLNKIRAEDDPTLSFRMSCGHGVCGSDGVRINGTSALACQKLVRDFKENEEVLIEPLQVFRVIKDLVVDMNPFFDRYNFIRPYLITKTPPSGKERPQSIEEHKKFEDAIRCILCACCTASCPVNQDKATGAYIGPAALVRAFRYLFDSRDEGSAERIALLDNKDGAWGCQTKWMCTKVCPKEIPVTKEIFEVKKLILESRKGEE
ncbi:MAG: succinate dehydrogenase iron-sulfur subunit [Candidatus Methanoperedens sp.]|nr:succinate dehydrogenase iron-sulfur subunit [Candidatus Methanoperedens sp.]